MNIKYTITWVIWVVADFQCVAIFHCMLDFCWCDNHHVSIPVYKIRLMSLLPLWRPVVSTRGASVCRDVKSFFLSLVVDKTIPKSVLLMLLCVAFAFCIYSPSHFLHFLVTLYKHKRNNVNAQSSIDVEQNPKKKQQNRLSQYFGWVSASCLKPPRRRWQVSYCVCVSSCLFG